jgi:hypothetical protein
MPTPWNRGLRTLLAERLYDKVQFGAEDECWPFTGAWRSRFGYGRIREGGTDGRCLQAHVVMYELRTGTVPEGMWLLHDCDNPPCCNPAHLRPGTATDNRRHQYEHGAFADGREVAAEAGQEWAEAELVEWEVER